MQHFTKSIAPVMHIDIDTPSVQEVSQYFRKLPNKTIPGNNNIPSFIIKDCSGCLAQPL